MLDQLRAATNALHMEVEQLVGADRMQDGSFTIDDYGRYLLSSYRFHLQIDDIVKRHASVIPYSDERIKIPALMRDLEKLNISPKNFSDQLNSHSQAAALGYLYVSEGSMLGAQVIYKSLQNIPAIRDVEAFHFLRLYHTRTGVLWSSLVQILKQENRSKNDQQIIVDSAIEAFALFRKIYQAQKQESMTN